MKRKEMKIMNLNPITMQLVADKYIRLALEEDIHSEDVSTNAVMPEYKAGEVELICKQDGVIAGLPVFERVFTMLDASTKVEWAKNVRTGYLDQNSTLQKGMTIESVLKSAFAWLFEQEERMNEICDQLGSADPDQMDAMMEELGVIQDMLTMHDFYVIDSKVEEVARALGLLELGLDHDVSDLSGGQRMKVLLAKLLLEKPDILLLDEPTNYLDAEHIAWLTHYLQEYENAFILISHDIPFLNDVVNIIYHMENQRLDRYVGNYDKFQEVYAVKKSQLEAAYRKQQQEISELKDFVARNKARVATRNMAMSRQKKLDKMDVIELAAERPKPEFDFKLGRTPGKYIFETKDLVIGYDEPLSKPLNISMERGQKIALVGANGIGKTTLLRSILGLVPALSGEVTLGENLEIGYFEQEIKGENKNTCIEEIWEEFPSFSQYEVRSALAKCGLTTKHIESQVRVLSGGEQAKVRLCKLLNRDTNFLLLDEPTNHLDIQSREILEEAINNYEGTVFYVSHDRYFLDRFAQKIFALEQDGSIKPYIGGYSDYAEALQEKSAQQAQPVKAKPVAAAKPAEEPAKKKMTYGERLELERLDQEIARSEAELKMLGAEINQCGSDFTRLADLTKQQEAVQQKLDEMVDRWAYLSELAEAEG